MADNLEKISADIKAKNIKTIKLLGDSITHGVGGTGFCMDGECFVENFARNTNGYCWANLLQKYLQENYGTRVINNGCSGTRIQFIIEHFQTLVDETDDLIICTIGTNNRHQYMHTGERKTREEWGAIFYENLLLLHEKFQQSGKRVIFMANIPASAKNEEDGTNYWRILHMDDINAIYKTAQGKTGFSLISLYDKMTEYVNDKKQTIDEYLADGLHPNDKGYQVIFELFCKALAI